MIVEAEVLKSLRLEDFFVVCVMLLRLRPYLVKDAGKALNLGLESRSSPMVSM